MSGVIKDIEKYIEEEIQKPGLNPDDHVVFDSDPEFLSQVLICKAEHASIFVKVKNRVISNMKLNGIKMLSLADVAGVVGAYVSPAYLASWYIVPGPFPPGLIL